MTPDRLDNPGYAMLLALEGVTLTDTAGDPGGLTLRGVTQPIFDAWLSERKLVPAPLASMSDAQWRELIRELYWQPVQPRAGVLPVGWDMLLLAQAVNLGPTHAVLVAQRGLAVACDGVIGPLTLARMAVCPPAQALLFYADEYARIAVAVPAQARFLAGWMRRLQTLYGYLS